MIKNVVIIVISAFIGFFASVSIYFLVTHQHTQLISPVEHTQFSLQNAPSNSLKGTVTPVLGNVYWLSRIATSPILISKTQPLQQGEEVDTQNGTATIDFSNTTHITVEKNTQLAVVQTLPVNIVFQEKTGSASFGENGNIPLAVRGMDLLINVESGQVSVAVNKDTSKVSVSVKSGSAILAYTDTNDTSQTITIPSGKSVTFDNNTKEFSD